jgi:hypothetical protein
MFYDKEYDLGTLLLSDFPCPVYYIHGYFQIGWDVLLFTTPQQQTLSDVCAPCEDITELLMPRRLVCYLTSFTLSDFFTNLLQ